MRTFFRTANITILTAAALACSQVHGQPPTTSDSTGCNSEIANCFEVKGTGIHYFSTAIIHSVIQTETGIVQRSTDTVELFGDISGRVVYHPVTEIDFASNTMVNTGHQVFSGTVLGGEPVLIVDDSFRFDVDLNTGATVGKVYLDNTIAGPKTRCRITIVGTGMTEVGDALAEYSGWCRVRPEEWRAQQVTDLAEIPPYTE